MSFGALRTETRPTCDFIDVQYYYRSGVMEERARRAATNVKKPQMQVINRKKSFNSGYFSTESFVVLFCLTVSLLILPLVLPPLSPPPVLLLLLPIGMLLVLMVLAFMPSDVRNIAIR